MKKFNIQLRSNDITNDDFESTHNYEKDGVIIEINNDGGNWWIENVSVDGGEYNIHDAANNLENLSNNKALDDLIEEGIDIETALEELKAKWLVKINDEVYANL
jgi:hypothetical protein